MKISKIEWLFNNLWLCHKNTIWPDVYYMQNMHYFLGYLWLLYFVLMQKPEPPPRDDSVGVGSGICLFLDYI